MATIHGLTYFESLRFSVVEKEMCHVITARARVTHHNSNHAAYTRPFVSLLNRAICDDDDLRVQTLLDAQPFDHTARVLPKPHV